MKKYIIFNDTDGITASHEEFDSIQEAEQAIERIRDVFRTRGYYFTNWRERISPEDVIYRIEEYESDDEEVLGILNKTK